MMKNIKQMALVAVFLASVIALFSSCENKTGDDQEGFKMNTEQEAHYNAFITVLGNNAKKGEIPKDEVKDTLEHANAGAKLLKYRIEDKDAEKPIAKDTKAAELKTRFVPKKA